MLGFNLHFVLIIFIVIDWPTLTKHLISEGP